MTPLGFDHHVSLYLGTETVASDEAIAKAGAFFDQVLAWDRLGRGLFASTEPGSEDSLMINDYFQVYVDELPEVFDADDPSKLSLTEKIESLWLKHMGTHGNGDEQIFHVDFTLGYDQLLCVYFDSNMDATHIAWES
jgi:hypothetical protein